MTDERTDLSPPPLHVRVVEGGAEVFAGTFDRPFRIGRADDVDVQLGSREVRPEHAEVVYVDGDWWLQEVGRANKTFVDAKTVTRVRLDQPATVRLGWRGPEVSLTTAGGPPRPVRVPAQAVAAEGGAAEGGADVRARAADAEDHGDGAPGGGAAPTPPVPSRSPEADRELAWARQEAAQARRAASVAEARAGRRTRWVTAAGAATVALAVVVAVSLWWVDRVRQGQLEETLLDLHAQIRAQDVTVVKLRAIAASRVDPELDAAIAEATELRRGLTAQYEAGVRQTSVYRASTVTSEDEAIYRVARALGESEIDMPRGFVDAVKGEIHGYWLGPGRGRFARGIERARAQGVDRLAVQTFERYGLPRQLFYMALQESDFNADAVGPRTRWGIAKGMWQFIPPTARRYGLQTGPDAGARVPDPLDDRHDVGKATEAAAKYLSYIYTTDAQSSGLLVIASYNWGEGRIINGVRRLGEPQAIPSEAFEGIPETPRARSYWHFLTVHRHRMPAETKDYVMKIFAAAVIGENPRLFGFDFGDPLLPYSTADVF